LFALFEEMEFQRMHYSERKAEIEELVLLF
jgi:hypothetical protein